MPAYKDNRQGTWYASFYFENWQGVKQKKLKRGWRNNARTQETELCKAKERKRHIQAHTEIL